MNILVTGGAGFIGANFVRYWLEAHPNDKIINLDSLSYAGNKENIKDIKNQKNARFILGDICNRDKMDSICKGVDTIFHFAAETHVDRSILDSGIFFKTNVLGTQVLLECAVKNRIKKFIYISTDEVYGSIENGTFDENSRLKPNSPYAVSKASADLLCRAFWVTHQLPIIITRCSNNYGPAQYPEKVIPLFITNLLEKKKIPLYGKGANIREWIYVMDHCRALETVWQKGKIGEIYNVGSGCMMTNFDLAAKILKTLGQSTNFIQYVKDRPGHDFRYALNSSKIRKLGWRPKFHFETALNETISWYQTNPTWWKKIKKQTGYKKYFQMNYSRADHK